MQITSIGMIFRLVDIPADILSADVGDHEADPAKRPRLYEEMD